MAVGMHNMRLGRSLASLIGEAEGSEDALKAGHFNPRRNFSILDSVDLGDVSLGSYYEDTLRKMLTVVWPQKLLVLATIAAALVIGIALALVMPKRYTAEAYVGGGFADAATSYEKRGGGGVITVDASMLVETRSRLLQSQQLARRVVVRLGLERIRPVVNEGLFSSWPSWLEAKFNGDASAPGYRENMAAKRLLRGLSVTTEPRSYLIAVRYTARDPQLAALIANAFVAELAQQEAQQALSEQLATLGAKHPKVLEAKMRLEAVDASKTSEEIKRAADGNVSFAQANAVPSSPNPPFLIGLASLVGLVGGVAIAALRGRWLGTASANGTSRNARHKASKGTRSKNASRGGGCRSKSTAERDQRGEGDVPKPSSRVDDLEAAGKVLSAKRIVTRRSLVDCGKEPKKRRLTMT